MGAGTEGANISPAGSTPARTGWEGSCAGRTHLVQRDAQELAQRVQAGGARGAVGEAGRRLGCHPASSGGGCPDPGTLPATRRPPARAFVRGCPERLATDSRPGT